MKKGIYAVLAILTVFALVLGVTSCGGDSSSGSSDITITLNPNGGELKKEIVNPIKIKSNSSLGDKLPGASGFAKTAGTFKEWQDDKGTVVTPATNLKKTQTLKAIWEVAALYTVTFDINGGTGTVPAPLKQTSAGAAITMPAGTDLTGPGSTPFFAGWSETATGASVGATYTPTKDTTLYAVWSAVEQKYTVSFDLNGGTGTVPSPITQTGQGAAITLPLGTGLTGPADTPNFGGWSTSKGGNALSGTTYTPAADVTLYAVWSATPTVPAVVKFDLNGGTGTVADVATTVGAEITLPVASATLTGPAGKPNLRGWATTKTAAVPNVASPYVVPAAEVTLYAVWVPTPGPAATSIVEELNLNNGWFAIYKFEIPAGKTWGDYKHVRADYNIKDASREVRARVFGNYVQSEIDNVHLGTRTVGADTYNIAVVASWPSGDTGSWILDNTWAGPKAANDGTFFGTAVYPAIADNEWFNITYPELGKNPHGQWNNGNVKPEDATDPSTNYRYKEGRRPADTATGTFYLGLGFTSTSADDDKVIRSQITNVTLFGDGVTDVPGVPLFIKKDGALYRAFAGQLDGTRATTGLYPNFNNGKPEWKITAGETNVTSVDYVERSNITVTYDLNYPTSDSATAPAAVTFYPGSRFSSGQANVVPAFPATPPTTDGYVWLFQGWYTAPTGGGKIVDRWEFETTTTIYAQWTDAEGVKITFDVGEAGDNYDVWIEKGKGKFRNDQIVLPEGVGVTGKVFGGWYSESVTAFDATKLITTNMTFDANTTIYAYWYTPGDTTVGSIVVEAKGGGRIDEDGYVIFAGGPYNAYLSGNANDTLLTFKFPGESIPAKPNMKITYLLKNLIVPTADEGWTVDAALIWKKNYNSWDSGSGGTYVSWSNSEPGSEKTITKLLSQIDPTATGVSIQINGGDDANNKQKRAGYVYGIKIINIEFVD